MSETLSPAQERMRQLLRNPDLAKIVGGTFAEVLVESLDAKREAAHWKKCFDMIRAELKVLVAVLLKRGGHTRLIIRKAEFDELAGQNLELWTVDAEDDVRVYELRQKTIAEAVKHATGTKPN